MSSGSDPCPAPIVQVNEWGRYRGGDEGRDEATSSESYGKREEGKDQ